MNFNKLIAVLILGFISQCNLLSAQAPVADFTVSLDTACIGSQVQFTDLSLNAPTSWQWNFPGASPATSTLQNPIVTYTNSGGYNAFLTVNNAFGTNTKGKQGIVKVVSKQAPQIMITNTTPVLCAGSPGMLVASGANSYTWNGGLTGSSLSIALSTTTIYYVTGISANGCPGTASITVAVSPKPTLTVSATQSFVCLGSAMAITASGASSYSWSTGPTAPTIVVAPATSITYVVEGNSAAGCTATASIVIRVEICSALREQGSALNALTYPNPVKNKLRLILNAEDKMEVILYDCSGRQMISQLVSGEDPQLDLSALPSGVYLMCASRDHQKFHARILKE